MSTSSVLQEAWSAVEQANLPEKIHEVAFREAVRLIAPPTPLPGQPLHAVRNNSNTTSVNPGGNGVGGSSSKENAITLPESELVQKVSDGTAADANALANLIYIDDGVLRLNLPGIKLGKNNADRTRAIAAVFTIVRSFGLDEDDTSVELVRDEAQRLKCYDSANFSSQLKALQGFIIKGSGTNRRIQAKGPGLTEFPNLIAKLAE